MTSGNLCNQAGWWASRSRAVACVLGVLAYLLLPALHAWHIDDRCSDSRACGAASAGGEDGGGKQACEHPSDRPVEPKRTSHDANACGLCQVFHATAKQASLIGAGAMVVGVVTDTPEEAVSVASRPVAWSLGCAVPRGPPFRA